MVSFFFLRMNSYHKPRRMLPRWRFWYFIVENPFCPKYKFRWFYFVHKLFVFGIFHQTDCCSRANPSSQILRRGAQKIVGIWKNNFGTWETSMKMENAIFTADCLCAHQWRWKFYNPRYENADGIPVNICKLHLAEFTVTLKILRDQTRRSDISTDFSKSCRNLKVGFLSPIFDDELPRKFSLSPFTFFAEKDRPSFFTPIVLIVRPSVSESFSWKNEFSRKFGTDLYSFFFAFH